MKRILSFLLVLILAVTFLPAAALAADKVVLSPQNLIVDGETIECEKYNINGSNYFKLRDIALLVNGTGSQFSVGYDAVKKVVSIVTGEAYTPNGSELDLSGGDKSATAKPSTQTILINGEERGDLSVYNIGGNNFFKLRDLGTALGFDVDYYKDTNSAVVISKPAETDPWDGAYVDGDTYRACIAQDLDDLWGAIKGELGGSASAAEAAYKTGAAAIQAAGTVAEVRSAYKNAVAAIRKAIPLADGFFSYQDSSVGERTKLLGILERYGVDTGLTGFTLFRKTEDESASNFKLFINGTDGKGWEALFGVNGSVTQTAKSDYWQVKPWLANRHFTRALSYAIDRVGLADTLEGCTPTVDYFLTEYMTDPDKGVSYNSTEAHKKAVASLLRGADSYGYSPEAAKEYFRLALTELEAEGAITPGTKEKPAVLHIEIAWMRPSQEEQYHNIIKACLESAFNDESVSGGVYQLSVDFWCGDFWSDVYYYKMMIGQFDLGFGSISGNTDAPLELLGFLSSDPEISREYTLGWFGDTNDPAAWPIVYDGKAWSYDALFNAADSFTLAVKGQDEPILTIDYGGIEKNGDGSYTGTFTVKVTAPAITEFTATDIMCCNYERYYDGDGEYDEAAVEFTAEEVSAGTIVITFTVPAGLAADYYTGSGTSEDADGDTGFDLYYDLIVDGVYDERWESVYDCFQAP